MAKRQSGSRLRGARTHSNRRKRRRLVRAAAAVAGTLAAATGAWFATGTGASATREPATAVAAPTPAARPALPGLADGPADPQVGAGRLELPIVDFAEVLPRCHP